MKSTKAFLWIIVGLLMASTSMAQHRCGITKKLEEAKVSNPEAYAKRLAIYNTSINENRSQLQKSTSDVSCPNGVTIIPIAFHVFHEDSTSIGFGHNFSEEEIHSVVDQLNTNFSGYDGYKNQIAADFTMMDVTHTCIQFTLAKVNRINISECDAWTESATHDDLHLCLPGGSGPGSENDPADYLNIYSNQLKSGFLGIASCIPPIFGACNDKSDGVSINWDIAIPGKNSNSAFNRGGVLTHEIGHWLGLPHVNGDINGRGCQADDGFEDTYPQLDQQFYFCHGDELPQSCDSPDNVFNFMDYSADCAKLMFTAEQGLAMQNILNTTRQSLSQSYERNDFDTLPYDVTCSAFNISHTNFDFITIECEAEINLIDYINKWYPSGTNKNNTSSGLSIFSWEQRSRSKSQRLDRRQLSQTYVLHGGKYNTELEVFDLFIKCWDPTTKTYSKQRSAGRLWIVIKDCPTPENDLIVNASKIYPSQDCGDKTFILNNASVSNSKKFSCLKSPRKPDVWFKVVIPISGQLELKVESDNSDDIALEVYMDQFGKFRNYSCFSPTNKGQLSFEGNPGDSVYVRAYSVSEILQPFSICMATPQLTNDEHAAALEITASADCNTQVFHNIGATLSDNMPESTLCGGTDHLSDVWFKTTVPKSGLLTIESFPVEDGLDGVLIEAYYSSDGTMTPIGCSNLKEYWPQVDAHAELELENLAPGNHIYIRLLSDGAISQGSFALCVTDTPSESTCKINFIEPTGQTQCEGESNTFKQSFMISYRNFDSDEFLYVNNQKFNITGSPQEITLQNLLSDGQSLDITANIGQSKSTSCWSQSFYFAENISIAPESCLNHILENDFCDFAIPLEINDYCSVDTFSNIGVTENSERLGGLSCITGSGQLQDVWFSVQAPESGSFNVFTPYFRNGNHMVIEVYEGSCGDLNLVKCDRLSSGGSSFVTMTERQKGETLYIRVGDLGGNTQDYFGICVYEDQQDGFIENMNSAATATNRKRGVQQTDITLLNVYPNPASHYLNIDFSNQSEKPSKIIISDILGNTVIQTFVAGNINIEETLDISGLSSGNYTITVVSENRKESQRLVVI